MRALFITGATGYIGRHLLRALDPREYRRVVCLIRTRQSREDAVTASATRIAPQMVTGDLRDPGSYRNALATCDTVLHLGAATGRAATADFESVNAAGTRALVRACEEAGVGDFLLASTIAVKYPDKRGYPYASSKEEAEEAVRRSSLRFTIVRPTIVVGREAPVWQSLVRLAAPRVILLPGPGTARVQPVHVDDVVSSLIEIMRMDRFACDTRELGGAEIMSFEELLRRIHRARTGREPWVVHLPLAPMVRTLVWLERAIGPKLPVTAGQLSAFVNDSIADGQRAPASGLPVRGVDQIVRECSNA